MIFVLDAREHFVAGNIALDQTGKQQLVYGLSTADK